MTDTDKLLAERSRPHGNYNTLSDVAQKMKDQFRNEQGWWRLSATQRESLDLITTKIARILSGNPNHADHWEDIAGYARLISRELEEANDRPV